MGAMFMSGVRTKLPALARTGLLALVAVALVLVGVAGASETSGDLGELLPHAVVLWQAGILVGPFSNLDLDLLAVEDVDGDGFPDVVCSQGNTILVFKGDGSGRFEEARVSGLYFVEGLGERHSFRALSAVMADLNRDGFPDLVVSAVLDEKVGMLFVFENERGRFILRHQRVLSSPAGWLGLAELSSDGHLDLLIPQREEDAVVYYLLPGEDDFLFGDPVPVAQGLGRPIFFGDVNRDGFPDLVLLHFDLSAWPDTGYITFLWGTPDGFQEATTFRPAQGLARHAALADLSNDGYLDLVVATPRGAVVALYTEEGFVEVGFYDLGFELGEVYIADMDGDGNLDLLCRSVDGRRLAILPGDGKGAFLGPASEYAPELEFSAGLRLADLNADGLPDLLLEGYFSIAVIMNGGVPMGTSRLPFSGTFLLGVGDLSGNGSPDLFVQADAMIEVLWNNGQGGFVRAPLAKLGSVPLAAAGAPGALYTLTQAQRIRHVPPPVLIEAYTAYVLQAHNASGQPIGTWELGQDVLPVLSIGDLDGDGRLDVVGSRAGEEVGALWVLWGGEELQEYPIPGRAALFAVADFTGDGNDQIAIVCIAEYADLRIVSFSGREAQLSEPLLQLLAQPVAVAVGDLDGDGRPDPVMVTFTVDVQRYPVLRITPSGAILGAYLSRHGAVTYLIPEFPRGDLPWMFSGLAVGDFTGDGLADVALTTVGGAGLFILPNEGDGTFGKAIIFPVEVGPLFAADLDGNGRADLVASSLGFEPVLWILWNGGGER